MGRAPSGQISPLIPATNHKLSFEVQVRVDDGAWQPLVSRAKRRRSRRSRPRMRAAIDDLSVPRSRRGPSSRTGSRAPWPNHHFVGVWHESAVKVSHAPQAIICSNRLYTPMSRLRRKRDRPVFDGHSPVRVILRFGGPLAAESFVVKRHDSNSCFTRRCGNRASALNTRVDEFLAGPYDPDADAVPGSRRGRRLFWADGLVSNISESFVTNFTNPFALALGATNTQMGMMSSITNLAAALALFPGARLDERVPKPQAHRRCDQRLAPAAAHRDRAPAAALRRRTPSTRSLPWSRVRSFFSQLGFPAWSAFSADLVPPRIRGRYFGSRNIGLGDRRTDLHAAGRPAGRHRSACPRDTRPGSSSPRWSASPRPSSSGAFPSPRARAPRGEPRRGKAADQRMLLRTHPRFAAFTAVALLWNLSIMVAGPYFSVYIVRNLGASPTQIGLLAASNALMNIVGAARLGQAQ